MPDPSHLRGVPTFTPSSPSSGLDVLATAALADPASHSGADPGSSLATHSFHSRGPYNPTAALPPRIVKKLLALEFVEMSEFRADIWPDELTPSESSHIPRRVSKPPVTSIRTWLECYGRMAAILSMRFPEKAAELWAYQTSIIHAAHTYEGANWVAYDRLYRREKLAAKDLNWSIPNQRLYSEAFTGRAKRQPQCPHCLSEDHFAAGCPYNPNPPFMGWFQGTPQLPLGVNQSGAPGLSKPQEICRNFNNGHCRFAKCRFLHACMDCHGPHAANSCPNQQSTFSGARAGRNRPTLQAHSARGQPYPPAAGSSQDCQ